jgi:hypothetical protein
MNRAVRDITVATAVLAIVAGCTWMYLSLVTVTVRNLTDQPLSKVQVGFTGKRLWEGALDVRGSTWTYGRPLTDGSVEISYTAGTTTHQARCGYVSPGLGGKRFTVELLPDGRSSCQESR